MLTSQTAAQRLVSSDQESAIHGQAFRILTHKSVAHRYVNDAVERAMAARRLGCRVASDEDLLSLVLRATKRSIKGSNLLAAQHFIHFAQQIVKSSGGVQKWVRKHREMTFEFVNCAAELANVYHDHEFAFALLEEFKPLCVTATERITASTLLVRQLVTSMRFQQAIEEMLSCLDEFHFGLNDPRKFEFWEPQTVEEVAEFEQQLFGRSTSPRKPEEQTHEALIMDLISYAGPTVYITRPQERFHIFCLGLSIAKKLGDMQESTAYLLAVHSMTVRCDLYLVSLLTDPRLTILPFKTRCYVWRRNVRPRDRELSLQVLHWLLSLDKHISSCPWRKSSKKWIAPLRHQLALLTLKSQAVR